MVQNEERETFLAILRTNWDALLTETPPHLFNHLIGRHGTIFISYLFVLLLIGLLLPFEVPCDKSEVYMTIFFMQFQDQITCCELANIAAVRNIF
jgi:hypothetical protein